MTKPFARVSPLLATLLALGAAAGCGGRNLSPIEDPQMEAAAIQAATGMSGLLAYRDDAQSPAGESALVALNGGLEQLASLHATADQQAQAEGLGRLGEALGLGRASRPLEGTVSFEGDHLSVELSATVVSDETTVETSVRAELDLVEAAGAITVTGTLDVSARTTRVSGDDTLDAVVDLAAAFDGVEVTAERCVTAGTLRVDYAVSVRTDMRSANAGGSVAATFGPACGDVALQAS